MRDPNSRALLAATLLVALAACSRQEAPAPAQPAPGTTTPDATPPPAPAETPKPGDTLPPPESTPASPAQPAPDAPPPTDPAPNPKPTAANEPDVRSMRVAVPSAKMGVAAELRYQFDAEPLANQAVTLHLAAVGRVPGQRLAMAIKESDGVSTVAGPVSLQKADDNTVYRQQFSLTRKADGPRSVRVVVTMDSPAGSAFGFFTVPLDSGTVVAQDSAK
jgi:hypothetical protein